MIIHFKDNMICSSSYCMVYGVGWFGIFRMLHDSHDPSTDSHLSDAQDILRTQTWGPTTKPKIQKALLLFFEKQQQQQQQ